ncbi:MAG: nucleotidyltransferase domain-containing protein [Candidatus Aenigmarchaeota archaeon]|nr:nucleotidyltransferase domain-containing protein [Candidatus Aenigmarchaeota archaeon]
MKKPYVIKENHALQEDNAVRKTIKILMKYPDKDFSLSDLAKEAGVAKANIGSVLDELQKYDYITIEKLSKIWRIRANQTNTKFIGLKIADNISRIYGSGLIEFLNDHYHNPKTLILFGSYRRGEDVSLSDIDIAIESDDVKDYQIHSLKDSRFEKPLGRHIQIHLFNRKKVDINVFNNIANGIVLSGFLEVRP